MPGHNMSKLSNSSFLMDECLNHQLHRRLFIFSINLVLDVLYITQKFHRKVESQYNNWHPLNKVAAYQIWM